ncbi:hypothetical protein BAE27_04520 [Acidithiobacillus caldus]|uniref:Uncharacterized protein n=1 Tax=Acidithiobacillus caldus TaxID=33059 RepID=A0A1E7YP59_9PROT|nr:hypothetical protein BAE27_04520 [Acidithiobacillus caldus]
MTEYPNQKRFFNIFSATSYYAFRENLESILPYASFAISEDLCTGIVSHRQDILGKVTVTTNSEWISELSTRFEEIRVASENFRLQ